MIHMQNVKIDRVIKPASHASNATASGSIDTKGYSYLTLHWVMDSATATTKPTKMAVSEGDMTSSFASVAAFTGTTNTVTSTSAGWLIPAASTSATQSVKMDIDLRKRKRYLKVEWTPGTPTRPSAVIGYLSRASDAPDTTTDAGITTWVRG